MSLLAATQLTAVATAILAGGAIVTSIFAILAFGKQSKEVALLQQQAKRDIDERRRAQAAKVYLEVNTRAPAVAPDDTEPRAGDRPPLIGWWRRLRGKIAALSTPAEVVRVHPDQPESRPLPLLFIAKITNTSELPIYKVAITWLPAGSSAKHKPTLIPAKDLVSGPSRLMPGKSYIITRKHVLQSPHSSLRMRFGPDVVDAVLYFRDAAGVGWCTDEEGNLIEFPGV